MTVLDLSDEPGARRGPDKLWAVIQTTPGWFPVREHAAEFAEA